jgi:decaprenyl-phosphate phosphoribosyltransferase
LPAAVKHLGAANVIGSLASLLRIRQWVKNVFVLAPLFFGSEIGHTAAIWRAASAFIVFCLVSSAVYIFNDWRDIEADRQHAKKASRPLPSGRVSTSWAFALMVALLAAASATITFMHLPDSFTLTVAVYLAVNFGYSLGLKHVSVIELFLVASGFLLRLIGGAYALQIYLSPWIIIATAMLALLMAVGKRRGDIAQENDLTRRRKSLEGYDLSFLDAALAAFTGGTIVVYLLFCVSDYAIQRFGEGVLITSVPVAVGLLRYLQLILVYGHGESPTDLVLGDRRMLAILIIFVMIFVYLIYF